MSRAGHRTRFGRHRQTRMPPGIFRTDTIFVMFETIANLVVRRGRLVLAAWVAVTVGLYLIAPPWDQVFRDDNVRFFPPGYPSVVGQDLLERGFPRAAASAQIVLVHERRDGKLTPEDLAHVEKLALDLSNYGQTKPSLGLKTIETHRTLPIGPRLIGNAHEGPGQAVLTIVSLNGTYISKASRKAVDTIRQFIKIHKPNAPEGLNFAITGSAVVGHDVNIAAGQSINNTTYATVALVVVILLAVYRSPLLALTPLVTIALSVFTSMYAIAALAKVPGMRLQVIDITKVFVIVVLFGAGTDYCLFLIARYREELIRGRSRDDALREAIVQVGGALVASAGTVIVGLGMLCFVTFAKIRYTGPAIALSLAVALLASLTVAPVLLHWLRSAVFWPLRQPHHEKGADIERESLEQMPLSGFWVAVADLIVRRPGTILTLCVLGLTPLAIVGARTQPNYSQLADLGPEQTSVVGVSVLQKYFPVGEIGPSAILIEHPGLDFTQDKGRDAVEALTRDLLKNPKVAEVRSLSRPLGKPIETASHRFGYYLARITNSLSRYVSTHAPAKADAGHITKLDVVLRSDPFDVLSLTTIEEVLAAARDATAPGHAFEGATAIGLAGPTAAISDLRKVTTQDERLMYVLVTLGVYVILVALIRRPGLCLYLIATVVLGYLASLGVTELFFAALHHGPEPWAGLDWKVGFFLFVILVAIGEDYNIFLMARVLEEEAKHGVIEGTRLAVAHTGGIISSCGLIMAGTLGSMLTGSLTALRELGFALGLGVLLDTFLVRPILVPAFIVLMHRFTSTMKLKRAESRLFAHRVAVEREESLTAESLRSEGLAGETG